MIDVLEKKDCTGCSVCVDVCPTKAISLISDIEGFWYPEIDSNKCTKCNLCEKKCPVINLHKSKITTLEEPKCFVAIHKSIETRFNSTSGGVFSALAENTYKENGYVGGAIYGENFEVKHYISDNVDDLVKLRQSKYSQSKIDGFYKNVKLLLNEDRKVLVCGTPCQMAGLRGFLGKDYENLLIVDFICKSITSPKFYSKYLEHWEEKVGSKLISFKFKDKELGWRELVKRFDFKNGKSYYSSMADGDLYSLAYHGNVVSRPSCYNCKYKGYPRNADITIADFWGVENYFPELDDNAGTSAIIVNTEKGLGYLKKLNSRLILKDAFLKDIQKYNPALIESQAYPKVDRKFFFNLMEEEGIEKAVNICTPQVRRKLTFVEKLKKIARIVLSVKNHTQCRIRPIWKFIFYNFLKRNVKTNWMNNGFIYPTPYAIIEIKKGAKIELNGPLIVGSKKIRKSRAETVLSIANKGNLFIDQRFELGYGSMVEVFENATLEIGNSGTNYGCTIICGKKIELRGRVSLGREVSIRDTNAHIIAIDGYKVLRPVIIENHTWLCSGSIICPGVKVKEGAVVGASSYVVQNVPAHSLVSGNPAKVVMRDILWKL
ncbi:Coenzyme F420 hydrogenase/dehydrogenase, beta subunit C-terminal domain [Marinifilum flexuosum]|uniref:Coenzyme F420 hydrogenase/dehydrogenase beta subunit n=1 Tax=Marinifilum flexuosum TaxID=1117708 RepID=A0A419XA07_9BACT|nr:Coenzyme F420 hydrogenase/dehydrogenase, beta subunit C-terminal domain [Marinifilum flexuosum]RKE04597.1 coenzyme F420 hydrogenase/dehydrogenase beta subunit [Marinifilum flexuosum]